MVLDDSPSLKPYPLAQFEASYLSARLDAARETGLAVGFFPIEPPFTPWQALDIDFLPSETDLSGEP